MNDTPHEPDDDLLPWLTAAREDAARPNADRLDRIGGTAREAFLAAASASSSSSVGADGLARDLSPAKRPETDEASPFSRGATPMTWILRTLVLAAAVVGVALVGWMMQPQQVQGFPLGDAFDRLREARSLRMTFREQDGEGTLWVEAPGQMRKEWSPTRYDIVQGSRLWRVDDSTVEESTSPYFDDRTHELDLFAALDLAEVDQQAVEALRPDAAVTYDDEACFRYEMRIARPEGDLQMVAYAGVASKELKSVLFYPFDQEKGGEVNERGVPLREFHLVAVNQAPPANAFAARTDLRGDGGVATIMEAFGVVTLRPLDQRRWTPICRETRLFPSDWLRAELRGAHAAIVRMNSGAIVTLGPGALVEFLDENRVRVHDGDVVLEATDDLKEPLVAVGPKEGSFELQKAGKQFLQVRAADTLAQLDAPPKWLQGLETTSVGNSLGSLLVEVDGRNVPLTIGEHSVKVTIRDQIARTVIEETFVNETDARLEGVFTFPLPADASISGFAMWVGNERVDADIVEKQRARQIYETILHEKRDPGLLEWTAGNIFQARVFPIEPNASKRIRIEYTQVLPMRSGTYRYRYALMSDMLRRNPLDELLIHVDVQSAIPLANIHSPTHAIRLDKNATTATAEFTAREYVPQSDFEMVFETSGMRPEVVFIPHQRGEDGYFLLQLTPPTEGAWKRTVLQDGPPLKILLLCDTSASMDDASRARQKELVQATLAALGPEDQFLLATTDVDTLIDGDWQKATEQARDEAIARLDSRLSFGWTDLAKAVAIIAPKCDESTHVLYLGDGIVTVGDATPEPALAEIDRIAKERALGTFHAMALGSTYEARMLKRLSQIGGGTYRLLNTDDVSARVVQEWLAQIATPGLTDIQLAFEGIRTAAVYPEELLRLPEGMQQIVVGRYQPEEQEIVGRAIVTGKLNGEPVKYEARITIPASVPVEEPTSDDAKAAAVAAAEDASFIPRLWGKARIDHLLSQSVDGQAKAEIIALSEHFRLITPYTSLLVLDSEADRIRFGVKRQVAMRDGERFFQSAEDKAKIEQRQKLLAQTARYRQGLRMQALAAIASMGRGDQPIFAPLRQQVEVWNGRAYSSAGSGSGSHWYFDGGAMLGDRLESVAAIRLGGAMYSDDFGLTEGFSRGGNIGRKGKFNLEFRYVEDSIRELPALKQLSDSDSDMMYAFDPQSADMDAIALPWGEAKEAYYGNGPYGGADGTRFNRGTSLGLEYAEYDSGYIVDNFSTVVDSRFGAYGGELRGAMAGRYASLGKRQQSVRGWDTNSFFSLSDLAPRQEAAKSSLLSSRSVRSPYGYGYPSVEAFPEIFPPLNSAPEEQTVELPLPANWTPEAIRLADRLVQTDDLAKDARLAIRSESVSHEPRWNRVTGRSAVEAFLADGKWLVRSTSPTSFETVETVSDGKRRAAYPHRGTGRVRDAAKAESLPSIGAYGHGIEQPLYRTHGEYQVRVLSENGETATLEMVWSVWTSLVTIDLSKNVVTKIETFRTDVTDGKAQPEKTGEVRFEDYVQAGGLTLPQKRTSFDDKGRIDSETTLSLEALAPEAFDADFATATSFMDGTFWLALDLPSFLIAKARTKDGDASLEDAWVVFATEVGRQGWEAAEQALKRVKELAGEKIALDEIQFHFDRLARRGEKALATATAKLNELAAAVHPDEYPRVAIWRDNFLGAVTTARWMEMLDALKPLYDRQPLPEYGALEWMQYRFNALESSGRTAEATELMRERSQAMPWSTSDQIQYARRLQNANRTEEALTLLRSLLDAAKPYDDSERDSFRSTIADILEQDRRYQELVDFLREWTKRDTTDDGAYSRLLWALLAIREQDEAEDLVARWIDRALAEEKLSEQERSQARAALRYRLGYVHQISRHALTVPMARDLLELGKKLLAFPDRWDLATTLYSYSAFDAMQPGEELRKEILKTLRAKFRDVTLDQIQTLRSYIRHDGSDEVAEFHRELAAYWEQERAKAGDRKDELTERLWELYAYDPFTWQDRVDYCRKIVAEGGDLRDTFQDRLVDLLLDPPSDQIEEILPSALREIPKLALAATPAQRKLAQLSKLEQAIPALIERFFAPKRNEIRQLAEKEPQKRADHEKSLKEAYAAAVDKTVALLADFQDEAPEFLRPWIDLFGWSQIARLERDHAAIIGALREIVGAKPGPEVIGEAKAENADAPEDEKADEQAEAEANEELARAKEEAETDRLLRSVLIGRAISMLAWFATREKAEVELVDFVRGWLEATTDAPLASLAWRQMLYQFLLARDDKARIEAVLRKWSARVDGKAGDGAVEDDRDLTSPWRRELAMFLAEQSKPGEQTKLDEAIRLFEGLQADRTLDAGDLLLLADWRLAQGDEEAWKAIRREAWELAEEYTLSRMLQQVAYAWNSGNHPETLEEETLRQIDVLFQKSSNPENYVWIVRDIYSGSKDFRLLANLPRQVVGRTSGVAYAFTQSVSNQVLPNVHEEATLDEMRTVIDELYKARTGDDPQSVTDRRLLDLLLATVEMRAANVLNQPGPHVQKALAALRRASEKPYSADEAVAAATFLRSIFEYATLGTELRTEILRQMERIELAVGQTSEERLLIANLRIQALLSVTQNQLAPPVRLAPRQQAYLIGQAAFDDFRKAHPDDFPSSLQELLSQRMSMFETDLRFRESERLLASVEALSRKKLGDDWYDTRLLTLWRSALYARQEVSVGSGKELYVALRDAAIAREKQAEPKHREERLSFLADIFTVAYDKQVPGVREDVDRFVTNRLDEAIKDLPEAFANVVNRFGSLLEHVFSMKRRLAFLLDRLEDYPPLLAWQVDHRNRNFNDAIAYLRLNIEKSNEKLGDLEEPTVRFMTQEIQREMRWRQSTQRAGWSRNYDNTAGLFWVARKDRFRDAALEVLAETPDSLDATMFVTNYLHNDLSMTKDAIVVLEKAWRNGMTDTQVAETIVSYLRTDGREPEAIPYLLALIERSPSNMQYRRELILAYWNANRKDDSNRAFDDAVAHMEKDGLRDESNLYLVGETGIHIDRAKEGVLMVAEAIRMRELTVKSVASGDHQYSVYFQALAEGYLKLGDGRKAFDAAASGVVVWPEGADDRQYPIERLRYVLRRMPEREKFLADWDAEVKASGKDSQLLRKELGRVLLEEGKPADAAVQLELAAELGGIDPELDRLRTEAYAAAKDQEGLRRAWIARVRNSPREYDLYLQFARTMEAGDPLIERAVTTTVELDPTEGGSHLALAGWRLERGDLDAARRQFVRAQELRTFDPAGWLGEADVLLRQERWTDAKKTIRKLRDPKSNWTNPPADLNQKIDALRARLPEGERN